MKKKSDFKKTIKVTIGGVLHTPNKLFALGF